MKDKKTIKEIAIKIEYKDHHTTVLTNEVGDTFTYNPLSGNGEELESFFDGFSKHIEGEPMSKTAEKIAKRAYQKDKFYGYASPAGLMADIQAYADQAVKEALVLARTMTEHLSQDERNEYYNLAIDSLTTEGE